MYKALTLERLQALVAAGENQTVEFKRKVANPTKIAREAVAFANATGGVLLIGIEDNLTIYGLTEPDGDEFLLDRALATACSPEIPHYRYRVDISDTAAVLVYAIDEGQQKPYTLQEDGTKTIYVRVEDRAIQASKELRQVLQASSKNRKYRYEFGTKESKMMEVIDQQGYITLPQFAKLVQIPERQASRTLVLLVLGGLLELKPSIGGDRYLRKTPLDVSP